MKVQVSNTNTPNWRDITVKSQVPTDLKCLEILAKNLWWSWNNEAINLFKSIDKDLWKSVHENPVLFLQRIGYEKLEEITKDKQIMRNIQDVYDKFEKYLQVEKRKDVPSISYFSMEYGLSHVLKIYSGGLGILAGDYLKEASDSNIDMTAVGFLYRYGYFTQTLSMDGQQIANYEAQNFNQLPIEQLTEQDGKPMVLEVPYPGRIVYAHIWRVNVGRIKLYLLDTDQAQQPEQGYAGFDFKLHNINIGKLVDFIPSLDTIVPMLRSFQGTVDFNVSAESGLDSCLNIKIPSLRSAIHVEGDSLVLLDGETFA